MSLFSFRSLFSVSGVVMSFFLCLFHSLPSSPLSFVFVSDKDQSLPL